jgi:Ran GTPase-activating protein 1
LDLSDNAFGPAGADPLRRLLIENRHIETLRLNNNGLGIGGGQFISSALLESSAKSKETNTPTALKTVIMGRNRLESQGAEYLSKAFATFPSLKELVMPQNSIRPEGVQVLLDALKTGCTDLEVLDLQDNTFTKKGSLALAAAIPAWSKLRVLNVGDCMLGKAGSKQVIKALTVSPSSTLQTLMFTYNEMDEAGAQLIPALLKAKKTLSSLSLNGNWFEAEADIVEEIRNVLRANGHVDGLDELEDMEEEDSDAEEESEVEEEEEEEEEKAEKKEADVDALTDALSKVGV